MFLEECLEEISTMSYTVLRLVIICISTINLKNISGLCHSSLCGHVISINREKRSVAADMLLDFCNDVGFFYTCPLKKYSSLQALMVP